VPNQAKLNAVEFAHEIVIRVAEKGGRKEDQADLRQFAEECRSCAAPPASLLACREG
jgi:hypothetical protein